MRIAAQLQAIVLGFLAATSVARAGGDVLPAALPQLKPPFKTAADRLYMATMRQAHYLLSTLHAWDKDPSLKLLTDSRSGEHWIRPNASTLVGLAVLRRWGPYDPDVVGVSRDALLTDTIVPMMRYLIATHKSGSRPTGDGRQWGDAWQSAHWAYALGRAAWFVWGDLPADVQEGVRRVVAHEASRFVDKTPPHGMKRDTKAEENGWNSRIFSAAILLMPDNAKRPEWEAALRRWAISSTMRPADAVCDTVVDGKPIREWYSGACFFDDFTCENHGFVHPGYMGCIGLTLSCILDHRLSGRASPGSLSWNAGEIYENLKWMATPDGGYVYPSGQDWSLFRNPQKAHLHLMTAAMMNDPDGWSLAERCWDAMERMQGRSPDGRVFLRSEYRFPSTQHDTLAMFGLQWLVLHVADAVRDQASPPLGVRHLKAGGLVLHRTPHAFVTLSYGAKVMAQCLPMRLDRVVSPDQRSLIGYINVEGVKAMPSPRVSASDIQIAADRFTASLQVDHGPFVRAHITFRSDPDGSLHVSEQLVALQDVKTTRIATGMVGVLNNADWVYESGRRVIRLGEVSTTIPANSGKTLEATATSAAIDDVVQIVSSKDLRLHYQAAKTPERGRSTDRLFLNWSDAVSSWKAGQITSEYAAKIRVIVPERD